MDTSTEFGIRCKQEEKTLGVLARYHLGIRPEKQHGGRSKGSRGQEKLTLVCQTL